MGRPAKLRAGLHERAGTCGEGSFVGAVDAGQRYPSCTDPRPYGLPDDLFESAYLQCSALAGTGIQRRDFCPDRCLGFLEEQCPNRQEARDAVENVTEALGSTWAQPTGAK